MGGGAVEESYPTPTGESDPRPWVGFIPPPPLRPGLKGSVSHTEWEAVHQWASSRLPVGGASKSQPPPDSAIQATLLSRSRDVLSLGGGRLEGGAGGESEPLVVAAAAAIWGNLCRATASGPSPSRSPGRTAGPWGWLWWCADAWTAWSRFRWSRRAERPLNPNPGVAGWVGKKYMYILVNIYILLQ